jgi:hypothetical protein
LSSWRIGTTNHPEASFVEIEAEARRQRRGLMGAVVPTLITGRDTGYQAEPPKR